MVELSKEKNTLKMINSMEKVSPIRCLVELFYMGWFTLTN